MTAGQAMAMAPPAAQPPLFDLLARSWQLESAIADVALDRADRTACFALADGRLALVALEDADGPLARMRVEADSGRSTIRPRERASPPPILTPVLGPGLDAGAPLLAASAQLGLIAATRSGLVQRITPRGQVIPLVDLGEPVFALATDGAGQLAAACDGRVRFYEEGTMARQADLLTLGAAHALAFAPDDGALALMTSDRLILGRPGAGYEDHMLGGHGRIGFSADGAWLAGSDGRDGFWLLRRADGRIARLGRFPAAPSAPAFSRPGNAVFASGAFRAAGWSLANPPFGDEATGALKTGRPGLVLVDRIAAHPRRDLVALGSANGAVSVARIGGATEMPLRQADGGAVTALVWSADGLHLAIGTASGQAAVVTLPPQLFK